MFSEWRKQQAARRCSTAVGTPRRNAYNGVPSLSIHIIEARSSTRFRVAMNVQLDLRPKCGWCCLSIRSGMLEVLSSAYPHRVA